MTGDRSGPPKYNVRRLVRLRECEFVRAAIFRILRCALSVELFDGQQIAIDLSRVETHGANSYSLYGQIRGHNKSYAILSVVNGQMSATIEFGETGSRGGGRFQVNGSSNGVHVLQQIDPASFPPDHPAGGVRVAGTTAKIASAGHDGESESRSTLDFVPKSDSGATIDVLVVYSNLSAAAAGSAIGAQIQQAVDTANQVYANSGITTRLRLVAYQQVKDVAKPERDYKFRLLANFKRDVLEYHHALGADAASAQFGGITVSEKDAKWMAPGSEGNKVGYFRVLRAHLHFTLPTGRTRDFELTSLISWRGEWYVVHLHGFK